MTKKIVLFELNEVPWRVFTDHVAERPHGALARLYRGAQHYETYAEEQDLSPWITWPSLHRGVGEDRHTITDFNQELGEIDAAYPSLWKLLADKGVPVGVCGSVHSNPCPENASDYAFYIPDPFARDSRCHPAAVQAFQDFNLAMSRKSARNVSSRISWDKVSGLLTSAPSIGLRTRTFADLGRQLFDERLRKWTKVRRRTYQSVLAFDVFMRQLQNTRPSFSTFFTNHVASTLHRFWAARYPEDYSAFECDASWVDTYRNEVRWVMDRADSMLAQLESFAAKNKDYEIWVTTSMGQAATEARKAHSQLYLKQLGDFLERLGIPADGWEERPAMAPRAIFALNSGRDLELERKLDQLELADRGPLGWEHLGEGVYRIHPGVQKDVQNGVIRFEGGEFPLEEFGFQNILLEDQVGQTAYHVPEGMLMILGQTEGSSSIRSQISTLEIAPMILDRLAVEIPAYMGSPAGRPQVQVA